MANSSFQSIFKEHYLKFVNHYGKSNIELPEGSYSDIQSIKIEGKTIPFRFYKSQESVIGVIGPGSIKPHIPQFLKGLFYFYDSKLKETLAIPKSIAIEKIKNEMSFFENKEQLLHVSLGVHEIEDLLLGKEITVPFNSKDNPNKSNTYAVRANLRNFAGSKDNLLVCEKTSYPTFSQKLTKD